ncbi:hypothetical protein [Streptomyces sp. NPDC060184]|uniref:hypothetical protein n=1 Tax=Streptomyces sp. NPDC060184 TaxID=3347064 RepID=UPI0036493D38
MPQLPRRIWSDEDWERIRLGYRAQDMDEKWNVYAEGDVVSLHRSWTGHGIFAATFVPVDGGGWRIADAVVERDAARYKNRDDAYDCVMLEMVISSVVLGEPAHDLLSRLTALTRRGRDSGDASADIIRHSAIGLRSDPQPPGRGH